MGTVRAINFILIALLAGTQYALWFGDKNVFSLVRLQQAVEQARVVNGELELRNQRMVSEVVDLKEGGETVETIARLEFGLIREGETFYQVLE